MVWFIVFVLNLSRDVEESINGYWEYGNFNRERGLYCFMFRYKVVDMKYEVV